MKIMLDAGHGGNDSGAIGIDFKEKDFNLEISNLVKSYLGEYNCTVYTTREQDNTLSLEDRVKLSNKNNCDIYVSIHCNAYSNSTANGFESFSYKSNNELQNKIHDNLMKVLKLKDRGKKTSNFYVIKNTYAKAVLLELGFITNKSDSEFMKKNKESIAKAITNGIVEYGKLSKHSRVYRVQVGVYSNLDNAKSIRDKLIKEGYNAIIAY